MRRCSGWDYFLAFFIVTVGVSVAVEVSFSAAPLAGSFQVDLVIHSKTCGVDEDGDTFVDEDPPNGIDDDGDGRVDEDGCFKVDDVVMKFEADLILQTAISGLEFGSATVFTFKGLEFQAFTLSTTIGALSLKDTFVFAPSIVEIEYVRTNSTLTLRYCVNASASGTVTPPFLSCPTPDSLLYWLMEDVGRFHPAVANLRLAQIFDAQGMLDASLAFRKKIIELTLNIAGLTLNSRALFANLGDVGTPSFSMGIIAAIEGQTVSGLTARAESWIGTRQGLECFSECKPLERIYGGKVVPSFMLQEEKLFLRNLTIAGVIFDLRAEFQFFTQPGSSCPNPGICYIEINSRARLQPLNLNISNLLRLGPDLNPRFDRFQAQLKFGDLSVTAILHYYLGNNGTWEPPFVEIISTFDPPGFTVTSDLRICAESLFKTLCGITSGILQHDIYFSATTGNFTWSARAIFWGLINGFSQLWVNLSWQAGQVIFTGSVVLATDAVEALAFSAKVRF